MDKLTMRSDPDAEELMSRTGVEWVIEDICISDIDWNASAYNCARLHEAHNQAKIDDYAMAMSNGDVFPMPLLEWRKSGLLVISGNQRMQAAKQLNLNMRLSAYIVNELQEGVRELLLRALNSRHGWEVSKEDRVEHAVHMVRMYGYSVQDAAMLFVVADTSIYRRIKSEEVRAKLARKGVSAAGISRESLLAISRVNDDRSAVALGKCVSEHKVSAEQVERVANVVEAAETPAAKIKAVKEFERELKESINSEEKPNGIIRRPRREMFFKHMEKLADFLDRGNAGNGFTSMDELQWIKVRDEQRTRTLAKRIIMRLEMLGLL